jgi:hypothetical protein
MLGAAGATGLPTLGASGIGAARFGQSQQTVVARLRSSLGAPDASGINTGCGKAFAEVAWHDLIVEFKHGRFSGYRFIRGGWPLTTPGSPRDRVTSTAAVPPLRTGKGITLGSTLRALRSAYRLEQTGAVRWTTPSGLTFSVSPTVTGAAAPVNRIVEIQSGTCGNF